MRTHMSHIGAVVCAVGMGCCYAAAGRAQSSFTDASTHRTSDLVAVNACSNAATQEVRSGNPMAGSVDVASTSPSVGSDTRTDVSGQGTFKDGGGATRSFSFRCSYDVNSGSTSGVMVNMGQ